MPYLMGRHLSLLTSIKLARKKCQGNAAAYYCQPLLTEKENSFITSPPGNRERNVDHVRRRKLRRDRRRRSRRRLRQRRQRRRRKNRRQNLKKIRLKSIQFLRTFIFAPLFRRQHYKTSLPHQEPTNRVERRKVRRSQRSQICDEAEKARP